MKPSDLQLQQDPALKSLWVDVMRMSVRADPDVVELVFSTVYDRKTLVDAVRIHTSVTHLKAIANAICRTLKHTPPKQKPKKR